MKTDKITHLKSVCRTFEEGGNRNGIAADIRALLAERQELLEALQECQAWFALESHKTRPVKAWDAAIGRRMIAANAEAIQKATT